MAAADHNGDEQPSRAGYIAAIVASAIGHAALFALVFFIAPSYLRATPAEPPAYTVKIVDNIPAGDLGTHLPRINRSEERPAKTEPPKPVEPSVKTEPPKVELAPDSDRNALALNTTTGPTPTITPTPEPVAPTPEPSQSVKPTPKPKKHATPKPTPQPAKRNQPKPESTVAKAKTAATPNVAARLAALKRKNFEEHVKEVAKKAAEEKKLAAADAARDDDDGDDTADDSAGGGPVVASAATNGKGMGIGAGTGSVGILQDPDFILYYKTVQDQIKKAWSFTGGSNDLTATVDFAIRPDGTLAGLKVGQSSNDSGFDDSVIRAIRRAAPFPAPPEKFRDQFSEGIQAVFQLGELKS